MKTSRDQTEAGVEDVSYVSHNPKIPPTAKLSNAARITLSDLQEMQHNIDHMTTSLRDMPFGEVLQKLYLPEDLLSSPMEEGKSQAKLLSTMSREEILQHVHHAGSSPPPVRPCDTANGSDTQTAFTGQDLSLRFGSRHFKNVKHLIQTSRDGRFIDNGEYPMSLGGYASQRKPNRGGAIDRTHYKYLDVVHVDVAFGDCISVLGYRYALILVDRAT